VTDGLERVVEIMKKEKVSIKDLAMDLKRPYSTVFQKMHGYISADGEFIVDVLAAIQRIRESRAEKKRQ